MARRKTYANIHGGKVTGQPGIDTNLRALTDGEYVLPKDTTAALGGAPALDPVVAATHTKVPAAPGLANGGDEWGKEYAPGGALAARPAAAATAPDPINRGDYVAPRPAPTGIAPTTITRNDPTGVISVTPSPAGDVAGLADLAHQRPSPPDSDPMGLMSMGEPPRPAPVDTGVSLASRAAATNRVSPVTPSPTAGQPSYSSPYGDYNTMLGKMTRSATGYPTAIGMVHGGLVDRVKARGYGMEDGGLKRRPPLDQWGNPTVDVPPPDPAGTAGGRAGAQYISDTKQNVNVPDEGNPNVPAPGAYTVPAAAPFATRAIAAAAPAATEPVGVSPAVSGVGNLATGALAYPFARSMDAISNTALRAAGYQPNQPRYFTDPAEERIATGYNQLVGASNATMQPTRDMLKANYQPTNPVSPAAAAATPAGAAVPFDPAERGGGRGLMATAAEAAAPATNVVPAVPNVADTPTTSGMTTEDANAYYGAQNEMRRAAQLNEINRQADQSRLDAAGPGYRETEMAKGDARVANFHAQNMATDLAGGIGVRGPRALAALAEMSRQATSAGDRAKAMETAYNAPRIAGPYDYRTNVTGEQAVGAGALQQLGAQDQLGYNRQMNRYGLQQHAVELSLRQELQNAKSPDDVRRAMIKWYAYQGKEPPRASITHGRGAEYTKPGEFFPTKEEDFFGIGDPYAGTVNVVRPSAAVPAAAAKPSLQEFMTRAKVANPNASAAELQQYYTSKYGSQ